MDYFEKLRKLVDISSDYADLPLEEMIRCALSAAGFDSQRMAELNIGEEANQPFDFGCYVKDNVFYTYAINERGMKFTHRYDNPGEFMLAIARSLPLP